MKPPVKSRSKSEKPVSSRPIIHQSKPDEGERIQKVLAHAGLGSRREIEDWIKQGSVRINGLPIKLGDRYRLGDQVVINGRPVNLERRLSQATRVLLYHKPAGEVVSRRDPEGRPVIFTQLPKLQYGRWIAVGRLDINTQGLILVTTNGELANRLMHPSSQLLREYAVRIFGTVPDSVLERMRSGVQLEDGPAHFETTEDAGGEGSNHWYKVTVREGRNRLVRRIFESQGYTVSRLIRLRYGDVTLPPRLKSRTFLEIGNEELTALLKSVGLVDIQTQSLRRKPTKSVTNRVSNSERKRNT